MLWLKLGWFFSGVILGSLMTITYGIVRGRKRPKFMGMGRGTDK